MKGTVTLMYWDNIGRIALYTLIIVLGIAIVVGAAALIINVVTSDGGDDTESQPEDIKTDPPETQNRPVDTPKETEADTEPLTETEPPETEAPKETEEVANVTVYETAKTMYALYNVNARMSYTTKSDIMGMFYQGDEVVVTGEADNGWLQVNFRGYKAYIRADLLTDDPSLANVTLEEYDKKVTMYATANVNVRTDHSTNSEILETIKAGTEVTVTAHTSNGWYRIEYKDGTAYINDEYLSKDEPDIPRE